MKPDYHREDDGLGISHSVTHRCSLETAHVQQNQESKTERKGERNREGGWDKEQEVVSERGERSMDRDRGDRKQKMEIKWKEV